MSTSCPVQIAPVASIHERLLDAARVGVFLDKVLIAWRLSHVCEGLFDLLNNTNLLNLASLKRMQAVKIVVREEYIVVLRAIGLPANNIKNLLSIKTHTH